MGWTWTHKPKHVSATQFLREMNSEPGWEVIADAFVERSEYYALVKRTSSHGPTYHFLAVYMVKFANSEFNIGWKDMTDTMGPTIHRCPERILDLADQLAPAVPPYDGSEGWANKWREACRAYHRRRKLVKPGAVLLFRNAITFTDGAAHSTFKVVKDGRRIRFSPIGSWGEHPRVRISNVADRDFEVIEK